MYLYDGNHSEESQYKAISYYKGSLDDVFVFIVDDWNWKDVREGTNKAIIDNNLSIVWKKEIRLTKDNSFSNQEEADKTWWNGIGIFILKKN